MRREERLIRRTAGVCGGAARVRETRIPVWTLVAYRNEGAAEAEILESFPELTRNDLRAAWAYYALHKEEIDTAIRAEEAA